MNLKKTKYRRAFKMAAAGTLLQDLESTSGGDNDLVQKILSDMNISSAPSGARPIPPPLPNNQPVSRAASGNSHITMDSNIPNSHIIGNEHPSPADFAAAITGVGLTRDTEASVSTMPGTEEPVVRSPPSKNMYGKILDETKVPLVVAFLFFMFSLPPIRIVIAHYMPSFMKATGELSMVGLAATSLIVGVVFWLLQRVIAPLLSL
jgi:hypothetical protein